MACRAGVVSDRAAARLLLIVECPANVDEWVEQAAGEDCAYVAHDRLSAFGYGGSGCTRRSPVAQVKRTSSVSRVRVYRPWITQPWMWVRHDFVDGPVIDGAKATS